jgi:hypothetical protein
MQPAGHSLLPKFHNIFSNRYYTLNMLPIGNLRKATLPIVENTRVARPYLFPNGQNMYNRVVLVCTMNVYIPANLGRRPIIRYNRYLQNCTHFTYSLRTDSCLNCREYCEQFEINTVRHLLSAIFIARYFKYRKQKTQPYLQSET